LQAQNIPHLSQPSSGQSVFLRSSAGYHGSYNWQMMSVKDAGNKGEEIFICQLSTNRLEARYCAGNGIK